jgi:hypothetical protein
MRRALLTLIFLAACGSFEEAEPSTPAPPAPETEGGIDAGIDTAIEAAIDGAIPKRFCESVSPDGGRVVYCRDFDDGAGANEEWNLIDFTAGKSKLSLDTTDVVSPPHSLLARIEANSALCTYAAPERKLGEVPAQANVSFDVRIGGSDTRVTDGSSYFVIASGACLVILTAGEISGEAHLQLGQDLNEFYPMVAAYPKTAAWAHVAAKIDRAAARFEISVDGEVALDNGGFALPAECVQGSVTLAIRPGLHCEPSTDAPREVRIDNVLVTALED